MSHQCDTFLRRDRAGGGLDSGGSQPCLPVAPEPGRDRQRLPVRQRGTALRGRSAAAARRQRLGQVDGDEHAAAVPADHPRGSHRRGRRPERDPEVLDAQRARRRPARRLSVDRVPEGRRVPGLRLRHQGQPAGRQRQHMVVHHNEAARNRLGTSGGRHGALFGGAQGGTRRRRGVRPSAAARLPAVLGAAALRRGVHRAAHPSHQQGAQPPGRRPHRLGTQGLPGGRSATGVRAGSRRSRPAPRRPRRAPPKRRRARQDA